MQKLMLVISGLMLLPVLSFAAPGDTTWVTVFENRHLDHYGFYDTTAHLPAQGTDYRKIRMHYILGRYACEPGAQYCGSWDYTTSVIAEPQDADTVEIARVITPYATDWLSQNRSHDYIIDISDYASILNDDLDMRFKYEGYSWGFTLTLKIEYIEGTPPMEALQVSNVYNGYYTYGSSSDPIETHLPSKTISYDPASTSAKIKNTISGHGQDDNDGCGEFCSKYYQLKIDGNLLEQVQLWKSDCGYNNIYPQTGTWLYDRANWCPGEQVYPIYHDLSTVTSPGTQFDANLDMQPYTAASQANLGGYNIVSQLIEYGPKAHSLDASIEDIIAPTNDPNHERANSICATPVIRVKNTGATEITSLTFSYGLEGGQSATYTWNGNLASFEDMEIALLGNINVFSGNASNHFSVQITDVNGGGTDEEPLNDFYRSQFTHVVSHPSEFVVYFKTNNTGGAYNETNWRIEDEQGNVVASRENNANSTTFKDTLNLANGCYTLITDDAGCDGLSWWVYPYYPQNPGTGIIRFTKPNGSLIKSFNGDFGCQMKYRFTVGYTLGLDETEESMNDFELYPNPADNEVNMVLNVSSQQDIRYSITDMSGKVLKENELKGVSSVAYPLNVSQFSEGVYMLNCYYENGQVVQKRFVVARQ